MKGNTEPRGFENPKVHLQFAIDSLKKAIQQAFLSILQTYFKPRPNDIEAFPVLKDFDIEDPRGIASRQSEAGDVETWIRISSEETRRNLVRWVMWLYGVWVLVGLIVFIATGNVWLLVTMGVLALPLRKIFDHYFPPRK
jgi:hypothetical protein